MHYPHQRPGYKNLALESLVLALALEFSIIPF